MLCTEDDNSCYRNVCKMLVVSFALAVVFIIKHRSVASLSVQARIEDLTLLGEVDQD